MISCSFCNRVFGCRATDLNPVGFESSLSANTFLAAYITPRVLHHDQCYMYSIFYLQLKYFTHILAQVVYLLTIKDYNAMFCELTANKVKQSSLTLTENMDQ